MHNSTDLHPGGVLAEKLHSIGISVLELARRIGVPNNRLYLILDGRRTITADTALRLGRFFDTGPDYWLNLQKDYELDEARQKIGDYLNNIEPYARHTLPEGKQARLR